MHSSRPAFYQNVIPRTSPAPSVTSSAPPSCGPLNVTRRYTADTSIVAGISVWFNNVCTCGGIKRETKGKHRRTRC